MINDVKSCVLSCEKCQINKHTNNKTKVPLGAQKTAEKPWDCIAIDFVGPLPRSKRGNKYLFVVVDVFSKFCLLKPMRSATAKVVVEFMENDVFLMFGVPNIVIADNGSQFISKEFKKLCASYKTKINYNAVYHAQHNPSERLNRVIMSSMRCYVNFDHKDWDNEIQKIACAMRTSPHESAGYSPYVINFGKHMSLEGSSDERNPNVVLTSKERLNRLEEIRKNVRENLNQAYAKYSKYYNVRTKQVQFEPGEIVRRKSFFQSSAPNNFNAKLASQYVKCRVREKLGASTYLLESLDGHVLGKYHANDMLKFVERI